MARNAIESDFRSSKMAQIGLPKWLPAAILKKKEQKLRIDLKWREMHSKVIFGHFRSSKMATSSHFVKKTSKLSIRLEVKSQKRSRNHFREDGMLTFVTHANY